MIPCSHTLVIRDNSTLCCQAPVVYVCHLFYVNFTASPHKKINTWAVNFPKDVSNHAIGALDIISMIKEDLPH